jgi:esterase
VVTTGYLEHDAAVGGMRLHYQEWGHPSAPAVIMLHGFGVSGHMFDEFAERMQDDYHLLALDQRGHGDSDWAEDGDYTREAFVDDLEGFREAVDIDRFILIGHSMGGLNAVSYANAHPDRVRALVLVDVGPESAKEGVDNIVRFTRGPDELDFEEFVEMAHRFNPRRSMENIRERMRHRLKQMDSGKYTWKFDARFRKSEPGLRIGSTLSNDETWQLFRKVATPTLLVRGAESDVLTQEVAERAVREMQRTRLTVVPAAGHSVPGDNPDAFTASVREFLADLKQGQFEPLAATEPPPLNELMAEQAAARRRGMSLTALVVAGTAAVLAAAGIGYVVKRRSDSKKRNRSASRRAAAVAAHLPASVRLPATLPPIDVESVRRRAVALVDDLSAVGRDGLSRARHTMHDVDLDRARQAATELAHALGEGSRTAPAAVRTAVARVDRKKLKRRQSAAMRVGRATAGTLFSAALAAGSKAARRGKKSRKRKGGAWRN